MAKTEAAKNEVAVVEGGGKEESRFLALRPDSMVAEAMKWNCAGAGMTAADLIRVSIPAGGATTWTFMNARGEEETTKEIVGALAFFCPQGTLWPSEEPEQGRSPVMVSYDLMVGHKVSDDIGDLDPEVLEQARTGDRTYDWRRLAYNQWDSGKGGRGKRCKEARLMAILREDEALPLLVSASAGSLKTVVPFVKRIASVGVPYFLAVVGLRLEKVANAAGQNYSQIVPRLVDTLSKWEGERVRDTYTIPLSSVITEVKDEAAGDDAGVA